MDYIISIIWRTTNTTNKQNLHFTNYQEQTLAKLSSCDRPNRLPKSARKEKFASSKLQHSTNQAVSWEGRCIIIMNTTAWHKYDHVLIMIPYFQVSQLPYFVLILNYHTYKHLCHIGYMCSCHFTHCSWSIICLIFPKHKIISYRSIKTVCYNQYNLQNAAKVSWFLFFSSFALSYSK